MQSAKLVRPNVERVILSESYATNASENQLYVHIKPVLAHIPASIFLRYWKAVSLASLSLSLSIGMLLFITICIGICDLLEQSNTLRLWQFALIIFVLAWVGQFYGHKVEGAKPSFFKDLQFLMIGPAWLMSFVYKKLGIAV